MTGLALSIVITDNIAYVSHHSDFGLTTQLIKTEQIELIMMRSWKVRVLEVEDNRTGLYFIIHKN